MDIFQILPKWHKRNIKGLFSPVELMILLGFDSWVGQAWWGKGIDGERLDNAFEKAYDFELQGMIQFSL